MSGTAGKKKHLSLLSLPLLFSLNCPQTPLVRKDWCCSITHSSALHFLTPFFSLCWGQVTGLGRLSSPRKQHPALHRLWVKKSQTELGKSFFPRLSCWSFPRLQSSHLSREVRMVSNFSWPKLLPAFLCSTQQHRVFVSCLWSLHLGNKLVWGPCKESFTGKGVEVKPIVESAVINKRILLWRGSRGNLSTKHNLPGRCWAFGDSYDP